MLTSEKVRGRSEAPGDPPWGRIEGKRIWCIHSAWIQGMGTSQLHTGKLVVGLCGQRIPWQIRKGCIRVLFQKVSHWHFPFASFSSELCVWNVMCIAPGCEETGWIRLNSVDLFFPSQICLFVPSLPSEPALNFSSYPFIYQNFLLCFLGGRVG